MCRISFNIADKPTCAPFNIERDATTRNGYAATERTMSG